MDRRPPTSPPFPVLIPSSSDEDEDGSAGSGFSSPSPSPLKKRLKSSARGGAGSGRGGFAAAAATAEVMVIEDDPTPHKPTPACTPSLVAETPLPPAGSCGVGRFDSDVSIVKCSFARDSRPSSSNKFSGTSGVICLELDDDSEGSDHDVNEESCGISGIKVHSEMDFNGQEMEFQPTVKSAKDGESCCFPTNDVLFGTKDKDNKIMSGTGGQMSCDRDNGATSSSSFQDSPQYASSSVDNGVRQDGNSNNKQDSMHTSIDDPINCNDKEVTEGSKRNNHRIEAETRKKQLKEDKLRLIEEKKQKRQQEKLKKQALKAEAAETKKREREIQKWEKGKFALKSIVAEIDAKIVENGLVGGHLLSRFAEKDISFHIKSNPIAKSILWKMNVPDEIAQVSSAGSQVPYILLLYQAEEFCDLVISESFTYTVHRVQSLYPTFTICFLINKLMSYINKREQIRYKNLPNTSSWRRPPVEEVLAKLTTHYMKVHSRLCIDEAEVAEHIVGLTCSLSSCQFRKKLTWLSVHANGSIIPKGFIDKNLIKKNLWLKALIAIPKVQPRHAIAIWKKYPTMRSLLTVYMDPRKMVHEKEFLLKDLTTEGLLGTEERRIGEVCSKRIYRILMAESGGIETDDAEEGADFFSR